MGSKKINTQTRHNRRRQLFGGRATVPCCFCRKTLIPATATIEHVRPISRGGSNDLSNLRLSCSPCNYDRGVRDFDEFQRETRKRIEEYLKRANQA